VAHDFFPEWLLKAGLQQDDELCRKRIQALDDLTASCSSALTLTLVRLFLGRQVAGITYLTQQARACILGYEQPRASYHPPRSGPLLC
jgi:hypothetical protein